MKVLLFDEKYRCVSNLSAEHVTVDLLTRVKAFGGSFIHCPLDMVSMISGKDSKEALNNLLSKLKEGEKL